MSKARRFERALKVLFNRGQRDGLVMHASMAKSDKAVLRLIFDTGLDELARRNADRLEALARHDAEVAAQALAAARAAAARAALAKRRKAGEAKAKAKVDRRQAKAEQRRAAAA